MNTLIVIASLVVVCVGQAQDGATTAKVHHHSHHSHAAHAHTTHEPKETDQYSFVYDGRSHDMVVKTADQCYIMPLTDRQRNQVHDPDNIKKVEAAALKLIVDKSVDSNIDQSILDHHLAHFCKGSSKVILLTTSHN